MKGWLLWTGGGIGRALITLRWMDGTGPCYSVTVLQCYSVTVLHYQRLHNETPLLLDQLGNTVDQYNQEIQLEIQNETRLFDPPIQFTLSQIFITIHPGTYVQLLPKKLDFDLTGTAG